METPLIKILGHRGTVQETTALYQNSLAAFRYALTQAQGFETDACLCAETVYLIHPTRTVQGKVVSDLPHHFPKQGFSAQDYFETLSPSQVRALRLPNGEAIPTLEQALALFEAHLQSLPAKSREGMVFNLELKSPRVAEAVVPVLQPFLKRGILREQHMLFSSFIHTQLPFLKQHFPRAQYGFLCVKTSEEKTRIAPWDEQEKSRYQALDEALMARPLFTTFAPDFFIVSADAVDEKTAALMRQKRLSTRLAVWTKSEEKSTADKRLLRQLAEDGILTCAILDEPAEKLF